MLEISTETKGDIEEIKLVGRLDVKAAKEADTAFANVAELGRDVVLNCSELVYIASAGLRALKRLRSAVRENGKSLVVKDVQPDVMEVFEMTGFAAMLTFA